MRVLQWIGEVLLRVDDGPSDVPRPHDDPLDALVDLAGCRKQHDNDFMVSG